MSETAFGGDVELGSQKEWNARLAPYREPNARRAWFQLLTTAPLYVLLWWAMTWTAGFSRVLTLGLGVVEGFVTIRLFMFFHDCAHGSFFASERANAALGRVLGVLTLTPFACWRRNHVLHHATVGDLDRRGFGDVDTLTVAEYRARSRLGRLCYRLSRHPAVYLLLGPPYLFLLKHRLPLGMPRSWRKEWSSIVWNDLAIAAVVVATAQTIGLAPFLVLYAPVFLTSTIAGIWLFYMQHQFDGTYWQRSAQWDHVAVSMKGSSWLELPAPLRWATADIGLHHLHHLCSTIPNYRLRDCQREVRELAPVRRTTLRQSFRFARLALWDEASGRLVRVADVGC